jgi:hypothetical protein
VTGVLDDDRMFVAFASSVVRAAYRAPSDSVFICTTSVTTSFFVSS